MKAATFDPARRLDLYFRCNRAGSKNFVFTYEDGTAYSFIYQEFALNIYRNQGERKILFILPLVYAANTLTASITKALSNINEGEYYYELYNVDTEETWLCGDAFFHNGKFDGVTTNSEQVTVSVTGEVINITLAVTPPSSSGPGGGGDVTGPASSTDNAITRYSGAGGKTIDQATAPIIHNDNGTLKFPGVSSLANEEGTFGYNTVSKTFEIKNDELDITLQLGQEFYVKVFNSTGVTIANRSAVYISGADAGTGLPTIALAQANAESTMRAIGITTHDIETGTVGYVTTQGRINAVDTSLFTPGAVVYLSPTVSGGITTTAPTYPNYLVRMGIVVVQNATTGAIQVIPPTYVLPSSFTRVVAGVTTVNNNAVANTLQDVTGLVFPVVSGRRYKARFWIPYTSATTTTGSRWLITTPATTLLRYRNMWTSSVGATTETIQIGFVTGLPAASNGASGSAANLSIMDVDITPSANGNVQMQFASEVSGSAITSLADAYVEYEVIG